MLSQTLSFRLRRVVKLSVQRYGSKKKFNTSPTRYLHDLSPPYKNLYLRSSSFCPRKLPGFNTCSNELENKTAT
jgi:hypothetical protein